MPEPPESGVPPLTLLMPSPAAGAVSPAAQPAVDTASAPSANPTRRRREKKAGKPASRASVWPHAWLVLLLPLLVYAAYSVMERSVQTYQMGRQAAAVRTEIEAQRRENLRLQEEINRAHTDFEIERAAREHLGLVRPGDRAVTLIGPVPKPSAEPLPGREGAPAPADDDVPPWVRWLLARFGSWGATPGAP